MKRRTLLLVSCIGIALLIALALQHSTQAQRERQPGQQGRQRQQMSPGQTMSRMLPLEASWAQISFELDVADDALPKVRKIYQEAWAGRKALVKKTEEASGDRQVMQSMRSDVQKLQSDIKKKLRDVLTAEQLEKLDQWEKENQAQTRRPPGMPPGGQPRQ